MGSQEQTSKEYSCYVAPAAGSSDLWTSREQNRDLFAMDKPLICGPISTQNTLVLKSQTSRAKNQENEPNKEETAFHLPLYPLLSWLNLPNLASR